MALVTLLVDPGEEILFLRDAAPGLARLVPLLGGKATQLSMDRGPDAAALWSAIGPRTRAVVVAEPSEDELLLLGETDVTVVLQGDGGAMPEHFVGVLVEASGSGAALTVAFPDAEDHPLAQRLAHVAAILEPDERDG